MHKRKLAINLAELSLPILGYRRKPRYNLVASVSDYVHLNGIVVDVRDCNEFLWFARAWIAELHEQPAVHWAVLHAFHRHCSVIFKFTGFWQVVVVVLQRALDLFVLVMVNLHKFIARANQDISINHRA